jgi:hypothetical protein
MVITSSDKQGVSPKKRKAGNFTRLNQSQEVIAH